jgi:DNA polymerase-3 subunit gamma/tau
MMMKFIKNPEDILNMSSENVERIRKQSEEIDLSFINDSIIKLSQTLSDAKWSTQPRILLELCIVKLATEQGGAGTIPVQTYAKAPEVKMTDRMERVRESLPSGGPENHSEAAAGNSPEARSGGSVSDFDCDKLWHSIFEEGETLKGSFNLLRVGTKLKEVREHTFIIEASSQIILDYLNDNTADLESLMEKHTGRKLKMECCTAGSDKQQEKEKTAEDLANEIGNKFGIHIDIQ